jgi:hypothetical protein
MNLSRVLSSSFRSKAIGAAVGSLMIRRALSDAITQASFVASRWPSLKEAGTGPIASRTLSVRSDGRKFRAQWNFLIDDFVTTKRPKSSAKVSICDDDRSNLPIQKEIDGFPINIERMMTISFSPEALNLLQLVDFPVPSF